MVIKWEELSPTQKAKVIDYDADCVYDGGYETAQDYAQNRKEAFTLGVDFVDSFATFVDWWNNTDEQDQMLILEDTK